MSRAASRINSKLLKKRAKVSKASSRLKSRKANRSAPAKKVTAVNNSWLSSWLGSYLKHLPTLIMGVIFAYLLYLFLNYTHPSQVKHFLVPNSFLPLLVQVFLSSFFLMSFLFLSSRRGLLVSLWITAMLFLKVQNVIITVEVILIISGTLLMLEIIYLLTKKLTPQNSAKL